MSEYLKAVINIEPVEQYAKLGLTGNDATNSTATTSQHPCLILNDEKKEKKKRRGTKAPSPHNSKKQK